MSPPVLVDILSSVQARVLLLIEAHPLFHYCYFITTMIYWYIDGFKSDFEMIDHLDIFVDA